MRQCAPCCRHANVEHDCRDLHARPVHGADDLRLMLSGHRVALFLDQKHVHELHQLRHPRARREIFLYPRNVIATRRVM